MRIGIYAYPMPTRPGGSGWERYFRSLLAALIPSGGPHDYVVYLDRAVHPPLPVAGARCQVRVLSQGPFRDWRQAHRGFPQHLRRDRIELFHTGHQRFSLGAPCPTVLTVHDLIPLMAPHGTIAPTERRQQLHEMRLALHAADHILASSRYTRHQLIEDWQIAPSRVTEVPLGCAAVFRPLPRDRATAWVRQRFGLMRPYLLSLGPLLPRKNHPLLIRAFRRRLHRQYDLVIAGERGWWRGASERILHMIAGDPAIRYVGPITDDELHRLYAAAECLTYPSEEEGFGLPPLEAMACGTPVVAMQSASLPEIIGPAGVLVAPGSVRRLAEALETLVEHPQRQAQLRRRGLARARQFSWETTAAHTLAVYQRVLSEATQGRRLSRAATAGEHEAHPTTIHGRGRG